VSSGDFGSLLRRHRLDAGLSQAILADRARLSVAAISAIERGARRAPHRETVALLTEALSLDLQRATALSAAATRARRRLPRSNESLDGRKAPGIPNNLPPRLTPFIGRRREVESVRELLRSHRLVTITGTGGIGKTSVAVEVPLELLDMFQDGIWFVDLSQVVDDFLVPSIIASTLGIAQVRDDRIVQHIVDEVSQKRALLVLDNCEHVHDAVAAAALRLLMNSPEVRILATSRRPLGMDGEIQYRLHPLDVPTVATADPQEALKHASVVLFVDRATAADAHFALTGANAFEVTQIVRRLDGIPLAIELAASRLRVLSARELATRLDESFIILRRHGRAKSPRNNTLLATIEWSYRLLQPLEQRFLSLLSTFPSGFTFDAAHAICGETHSEEVDTLDLLCVLIDGSLLSAELGHNVRYRMLESTRAYAAASLRECGADLTSLQARFLGFYSAKAREAANTSSMQAFDRLIPDLGNLRLALDLASKTDLDAFADLLDDLVYVFDRAGYHGELLGHLERALARPTKPQTRAKLLRSRARLLLIALRIGDAFVAAEQSLPFATQSGSSCLQASCLICYAYTAASIGNLEAARNSLLQVENISRVFSDAIKPSILLEARAFIAIMLGEFELAIVAIREQLAVASENGDYEGECLAMLNLAELEHSRGNCGAAMALVRPILRRQDILGRHVPSPALRIVMAVANCSAAKYALATGDRETARSFFRSSLEFMLQTEYQSGYELVFMINLAEFSLAGGRLRITCNLVGFIARTSERIGYVPMPPERAVLARLERLLGTSLSESELDGWVREGYHMGRDEAVDLASAALN
jgi:predicted ATPase/DNA-binding XRE family transcriptional regulator